MKTPTPIPAVLCSECNLVWDDHEKTAKRRAQDEWDDAYEVTLVTLEALPPRPTTGTVTLEDCVLALKDRFRGPQGFTGPTGAMGPLGTVSVSEAGTITVGGALGGGSGTVGPVTPR